MALSRKISVLPATTTVGPTDLHVIVQDGVTKKITHANLQGSYLQSANNLSDLADEAAARVNLGVMSTDEVNDLLANTFGEAFISPGTPGIPSGNNFFNGFASSPSNPLKVLSTGLNGKCVFFKGLIDCSAVTFPTNTFVHVFTLTTPYRPNVKLIFPVVGLYNAIGLCSVGTDGKVELLNGPVGDLLASGVVDLSNVSYYNS